MGKKSGSSVGPADTIRASWMRVLQLADISRPRIAFEQLQSFRRNRMDPRADLAIEAIEKVMGQLGNIADPFPQRRQMDRYATDAIVEILAEASLFDQRFQILIRGGDNPHVRRKGFVATDRARSILLATIAAFWPECSGPCRRFHREKRPLIALFELADSAMLGARERSPFMAKQFAFQQRLRNCRTIDRQKRAPGTVGRDDRSRGRPTPCRCRSRPGSRR